MITCAAAAGKQARPLHTRSGLGALAVAGAHEARVALSGPNCHILLRSHNVAHGRVGGAWRRVMQTRGGRCGGGTTRGTKTGRAGGSRATGWPKSLAGMSEAAAGTQACPLGPASAAVKCHDCLRVSLVSVAVFCSRSGRRNRPRFTPVGQCRQG